MSLFEDLQQGEIIDNPNQLQIYRRILKKKKMSQEESEAKKKREWKELSKKMKAELSPEEFNVWRRNTYYQLQKKDRSKKSLERYYRKKKEEEQMIEEIYKNVYDLLPEPINYDKLYAQKYNKDDRDGCGGFKFYWRASRLNRVHANRCEAIEYPVRVYDRGGFSVLLSKLGKVQNDAYNYIKPHIDEIGEKDFFLAQEQFFTKLPMWVTKNRMRELTNETDISKNQICNVASALMRGKYIISELYLGRVSFLIGDVIIAEAGQLFRPILDNNISWLTKDTVEDLHKQRFDWLHRKNDNLPIYVLRDAYLIKIKINERETYFYIVPT